VSVAVISCEQGNGSANYCGIQPAGKKALKCHQCSSIILNSSLKQENLVGKLMVEALQNEERT